MRKIFKAIDDYAKAYNAVETYQFKGPSGPLSKGDQKTGVFAEFYAKLFAQMEYADAQVEYAKSSTKECDLIVREGSGSVQLIQVKAVSGHSATSRISPIHAGWDLLYLVRLDKGFRPIGFWIVTKDQFEGIEFPVKHSMMPRSDTPGSGSAVFSGCTPRLRDMNRVLDEAQAAV
ncbi:hypothetical protein JXD38_08500 [candidate division WOR-3 bacterium]|nr:hypothetical protein [candidate division WOR-3 bacterium]